MPQYFCPDPSHRRGHEIAPVDVTAQVRLERSLLPRVWAYLGITQDVIAGTLEVHETGSSRVKRISELLTGSERPENLPVVLVARDAVSRPPGRYELDELRAAEPDIERLLPGHAFQVTAPEEEVVVLDDRDGPGPVVEHSGATRTALLPRVGRALDVPQGIFLVDDLAAYLAVADPTEAALVDSIRSTPVHDPGSVPSGPWRVVVECPRVDDVTGRAHLVLFTGTGDGEAAVVWGTRVDGWDASLESSALSDLEPAAEVGRLERRVWLLLAVEGAALLLLLAASWASGVLRVVSEHTPGWLALSLLLAIAGIAYGAIPLFRVHEPGMNVNDTFELAAHYESRSSMLRVAAAVSASLFGLGLMAGMIPPLSDEEPHIPAASVTFDTSQRPITATMRLTATDVGPGRAIQVTIREFAPGASWGALVASVTRNADSSGVARVVETFAVDTGARYLAVWVHPPGRGAIAACTPLTRSEPGCTVLSVPATAPSYPSPSPITNIVSPTFTSLSTSSPSPSPSP